MRRGSWSTEQETPSGVHVMSTSRISDQSDGVDGMGSVALREGAEEDEYFGMFCILERLEALSFWITC